MSPPGQFSRIVLHFILFATLYTISIAKYCPPGKFVLGLRCRLCPPGTYTEQHSQLSCSPCPTGTFSNSTGAQGADLCQKCPPSTFSPIQGSTSCLPCPAGTNSTSGASYCNSCPAGYGITPSGFRCAYCPFGTYRSAGETSQICQKCPDGMTTDFEDATSETQCTFCEAGSEADGENGCKRCRPPYYRPANLEDSALASNRKCIPCPLGFFAEGNGATSCTPCPQGTYKSNPFSSRCETCPPGTSTGSLGGASSCTRNSLTSTVCLRSGHFPRRSGGCYNCPLGHYRFDSEEPCKLCPAGSRSNGGGSNTCQTCEPGTMSDETGSKCVCPHGTFYGYINMTSSEKSCIQCPAGRGSSKELEVGEECPLCEQETISSSDGRCVACPRGSVANQNHTACLTCLAPLIAREPGKWLPDGVASSTDLGRCVSPETNCPLNFTRWISGPDFRGCKISTCPIGSFGTERGCETCTRAQRLLGHGHFRRCEDCPVKRYSDGGLSRECSHSCTDGLVRNEDVDKIGTEPCVCSGTNAAGRALRFKKCRSCPRGTANSGSTNKCSSCNPGSYADNEGCIGVFHVQ